MISESITSRSAAIKADGAQSSLNTPPASECSRIERSGFIQQELIRESSPGDLDVDDLAEAIRRLLDSGDAADAKTPGNSALHSRRNRATHVMGSRVSEPL